MKKILLTGGFGFIGRNIHEYLKEEYELFVPTSKELNLLDSVSVNNYLKKNKIETVIHCAVCNRKWRKIKNFDELTVNLKMFYHLAEHAASFDKLIYFGSGAEYDKRFPIHMACEDDFGNSIPMLNDYSLSKYLMNLEARHSDNIYNLRLFGIYGKYEDWRHCFISNLCCKELYNLPLTIRQDCIFDFLYIDDLVKVVKFVLENKLKHHDYNICSGSPIKLSQIAEIIHGKANYQNEIKILKDGYNMEYTGNNTRFLELLPLNTTKIKNGIEILYEYYRNQLCSIDFYELKKKYEK